MKRLNPGKLHVNFSPELNAEGGSLPRRYTLTHSDLTGDLFLKIGRDFERKQVSGIYTRLMRDEVLAEITGTDTGQEIRVYCHVAGGIVIGTAWLRDRIFRSELPLAMESIRFGDRAFFDNTPELDNTPVIIYFQSSNVKYEFQEKWGHIGDYR